MGKKIDYTQRVPQPLGPVETAILRNELECASADYNPDLVYEMACAMREMPLLTDMHNGGEDEGDLYARFMAIAWEGGRRYGLVEAMSQITDAIEKTGPELETGADLASPQVPVIGWIGGNEQVHFDHPERLKKPVRGVFYISDLPEAEAETLARATVAQVLSFHRHSRGTADTGPIAVPVDFPDATDKWRAQQAAMKRQAVADFGGNSGVTGFEWQAPLSAFQKSLRETLSADPAASGEEPMLDLGITFDETHELAPAVKTEVADFERHMQGPRR